MDFLERLAANIDANERRQAELERLDAAAEDEHFRRMADPPPVADRPETKCTFCGMPQYFEGICSNCEKNWDRQR